MLLIPPKPLAVFPALFWESNNCANEAEMDQSGSCQIIEQPNVNTVRKHPCFSFWLQKTIESKQEGMILWYIMNFPILPVSWVRLGCWVGFPPGKGATPLWPCHRLLDTMAWLLPVLQARQRRNAVPCPTRRFEGSHNARQIAADQDEIGGFHQHGRLSSINQLPDCWAWWAWRACDFFLQTWSLRIVSGSVVGL